MDDTSHDPLRAEIEKLRHAYDDLRDEIAQMRGVQQGQTRRRGVLASAGSTAESLLKFIYRREGLERGGKPADRLMLEDLLATLGSILPPHVQVPLRTVQAYRNLGAHDKGDIRELDESALQTVDTALSQVVVWFFDAYLGGEFAELARPRRSDDTSTAPADAAPLQAANTDALASWRELYWWLMRGGALKLLDEKALQSAATKSGLTEAALAQVRSEFKRDAAMFDQALAESLEDGVLENHEADGLEQVRQDACISEREATERAARSVTVIERLPANVPQWLSAARARANTATQAFEDAERQCQEAEARKVTLVTEIEPQHASVPQWLKDALGRAKTATQAFADAERQRLEAEVRARIEAELRSRLEVEARAKAEAEAIDRADAARSPSWRLEWMSTCGEDAFGRWSSVSIAGVEHKFRYCPPGTFMMGSDEILGFFLAEKKHRVTLTQGFWLGEAPVTQRQWEAVGGTNPSCFKGPDLPVESVSWDDCVSWMAFASVHAGGLGLRLPTEAEWEYACRAGTTGITYRSSHDAAGLDAIAWYAANSGFTTHPVKEKVPNDWGLYDMLGNVREWCADNRRDYTSSEVTNPHGGMGESRIYRGGSWYGKEAHLRAAYRGVSSVRKRIQYLGFRVAVS